MKNKKWIYYAVTILMFFTQTSRPARAYELSALRIAQAVVTGEEICVYFDALDENGNPISRLNEENLTLILGNQKLNASVQRFAESKEGIGVVFGVDVSKSLSQKQLEQAKAAISEYAENMGQFDVAAVVAFGSEVSILSDFSNNADSLKRVVSRISLKDDKTFLFDGISKSLDIARRLDTNLPARRVIIILTDGIDDNVGGLTLQEVRDKLDMVHIPIYAIGFQAKNNKGNALSELGVVARSSGGDLMVADDNNAIDLLYDSVIERIQGGYMVKAMLPGGVDDGVQKGLSLTVTVDGRTLDNSIDLRIFSAQELEQESEPDDSAPERTAVSTVAPTLMPTLEPETNDSEEKMSIKETLFIVAIILMLLCAAATVIWFVVKKKKKNADPDKSTDLELNDDTDEGSQATIEKTEPLDKSITIPLYPLTETIGTNLNITETGRNGEKNTHDILLKDSISIGRSSRDNQLVLDDRTVSARHCELYRINNCLHVRDLQSQNGTFVNGEKAETAPVLNGDILRVGLTELKIEY